MSRDREREKTVFDQALDNFQRLISQQISIAIQGESLRQELKTYIDNQQLIQQRYIETHIRNDIAQDVYNQVKHDIEIDIKTRGFEAIDELEKRLKRLIK